MEKDNRDQQLDQLLRGVSGLCASKEDCTDCPFHGSECFFGEPKPAAWFGKTEEKAEVKTEVKEEPKAEPKEEPKEEIKEDIKAEHKNEEPKGASKSVASALPKPAKESQGTWLVSTTMGGVFSKYVFICSKCGYKKESFLSVAPTSNCPECEKNK